jgi:hypothetical protein
LIQEEAGDTGAVALERGELGRENSGECHEKAVTQVASQAATCVTTTASNSSGVVLSQGRRKEEKKIK